MPLKAAIRREGNDVTIVSWGRAAWTSMKAAEQLAKEGISAEVIDLRTIVPPDRDTIYASVERTGRLIRLLDRAAGYVRTIQGHVTERFPGFQPALGQHNIPRICQNVKSEDATILRAEHIITAAQKSCLFSNGDSRLGLGFPPIFS